MSENLKNELIKRHYRIYLKEAGRQAESSILIAERAIRRYEEFFKKEDFGAFNADKAIAFKNYLKEQTLAIASYGSSLRQLKKFLIWLAYQPGYKSKIEITDIDYLQTSNAENSMINGPKPRNFPQLEYVLKLVESIHPVTEIDMRDRALIAFACLTGMRDSAIVSLPLGCFDETKMQVFQSPEQGVKTKFSKTIFSIVFKFDDGLLKCVLAWKKHLKEKGFGTADPLFPRSRNEQGKDSISFAQSTNVEKAFWQGAGRMREIFKQRATAAGLSYFPPHTYRHLAISLAFKKASTGEELKAISQNFGHEHLGTTLAVYGNYQPGQLMEVLHHIDDRTETKFPNDQVVTAELVKKMIDKLAKQ